MGKETQVMLRLRDVMTTEMLTLDPQLTIREAMELLSSNHVAGAPVVSGSKLVGVISSTDLLSFAAELPGTPAIRPRQSFTGDDDIDFSPAVDGDQPTSEYFLSLWQDAGAESLALFADSGSPEWNVLEQYTVSDVMTRAPLRTLPPSASILEAADMMGRDEIHRVLVVEDGKLVGIVSASDIADAAADSKLGRRVYVFPPGGA